MITRILTAIPAQCDPSNPLCGVKPDPSVFGDAMQGKVSALVSGIWFLVLVGCAVAMLIGIGRWAYARNYSHSADALQSGAEQAKKGAMAFGVAAGASLILAAVLKFVNG